MPHNNSGGDRESTARHLILGKRYEEAIELLRAQVQGGLSSVRKRLQFADVLILAGRGQEALQVLLALADDFAAEGFVAKAVAVLKRIEKIEPGRPDVASRFRALVGDQHRYLSGETTGFTLTDLEQRLGENAEEKGELPLGQEVKESSRETEDSHGPLHRSSLDAFVTALLSIVRRWLSRLVRGLRAAFPQRLPQETTDPKTPGDLRPSADAAEGPLGGPEGLAAAEGEAALQDTKPPEEGSVSAILPDAFVVHEPPAEEGGTPRVSASEDTPSLEVPTGNEELLADSGEEHGDVAGDALPTARDQGEQADESGPPQLPGLHEEEETQDVEAQVTEAPSDRHRNAGLADRMRRVFRTLLGALPRAGSAPGGDHETHLAQQGDDVLPEAASSPPLEHPGERLALEESDQTLPTAASDASAAPTETDADEDLLDAVGPDLAALEDVASEEELFDLVRDVVHAPPSTQGDPRPARETAVDPGQTLDYARRLLASPLFRDLVVEELLAVVEGLRLLTFDPGDIILTEGEPGQSLFIVTSGSVTIFVRNPTGRNISVGTLGEGDFFGEISSLSGRPRTATVTAAERTELLELDKPTLDSVALRHRRVKDLLEQAYVERLSSPYALAARTVPVEDPEASRRATFLLESYFGGSEWNPRMRLRLADVLFKSGKGEDVAPILIGLADELSREGFPERAVALLKKVEELRRRHVEEINLAPLVREKDRVRSEPREGQDHAPPERPPITKVPTGEFFQNWLLSVAREALRKRQPARELTEEEKDAAERARGAGYLGGLKASPLFESFSEEELLAFVEGLHLRSVKPGQIILTEGEAGRSLFVLAVGRVKVFVKNLSGRNIELAQLPEGAFFGEISALTQRPRSATVTAAAHCELLELDPSALESVDAAHPGVRAVLEEFFIERATSPEAARARGQ